MRIAIAGGTGTLGTHLTSELRSRGHEVRVRSRSAPQYRVDLRTGAGLAAALEGCVVVDVSNNGSPASIRDLGAWLTTAVSRLAHDVLGSARVRRERYVGRGWMSR
jgi:nucleoside-diphosphate-sugar epimerase